MHIKKLDSGRWQADIRIQNKRKRKSFNTKAEATRWVHHIKSEANQGKDWNPSPKDNRTILELANTWYELHGKNLADKGRKQKIINICSKLGNPILRELTQKDLLKYRSSRIDEGISICTVNKELTYLKAIFNFLMSSEIIDINPLEKTKKLKETQQNLATLKHQILSYS